MTTHSSRVHALPDRWAERAFCGASDRDYMYSSSPTGEMVTCKSCLHKLVKLRGPLIEAARQPIVREHGKTADRH